MPTIQILNVAAFAGLLDILDSGGGTRISDFLMSGDFKGAWQALITSSKAIFEGGGFADIMSILAKAGIARFVVDNTPLRKQFTIGKITVGI